MKKFTSESVAVLQPYFNEFQSKISDVSLTNLVIWNSKYHYYYAIVADYILIVKKNPDSAWHYSMPIGPRNDGMLRIVENLVHSNKDNIIIDHADKYFIRLLKTTNYKFQIESARDEFDYIYSFEALKNLTGKRLHKKKNLVNNFQKNYPEWSFRTYTPEDYEQVLSFLKTWYQDKMDVENLMTEWEGIIMALQAYDDLSFEGGLLFVDETLVAFTMVELITKDTLVVHIEKGNTNYKGVYNALQYQLLQRYDRQLKWVNREQDLGIANLRKAKMSYHPAFFEQKYKITILK